MLDLFTYTPPKHYPETCGFKTPGASQEAAERMDASSICEWLRRTIPCMLEAEPRTAKELAGDIGVDKDLVKPRLSELKDQRKIIKSESRRNKQHVWCRI